MHLFARFSEVKVSRKRDEKSRARNIHDFRVTPTDTLVAIIEEAVQIVSMQKISPYRS